MQKIYCNDDEEKQFAKEVQEELDRLDRKHSQKDSSIGTFERELYEATELLQILNSIRDDKIRNAPLDDLRIQKSKIEDNLTYINFSDDRNNPNYQRYCSIARKVLERLHREIVDRGILN